MSDSLKRDLSDFEIPEYYREKHIKSGYRLGGTYTECIKSMIFFLHNETMNAYTMIIAAVLSTTMYYYTMQDIKIQSMDYPDICIFFLMWFHCVLHMPFSVAFHTFGCINKEVFYKWRTLDMSLVLLCGSILTFILSYYVFTIYFTICVSLCALLISFIVINNMKNTPDISKTQVAITVGLIITSYVLPVWYQMYIDYFYYNIINIPFYTSLSITLGLFGGGCIYKTRFPESLYPGVFDICFNSHNIMHIGVIIAHYSEWIFLHHMYTRRALF